jgi:GntR family transcriptional regulator, transcriptional repressor for pyruvate dehydrogenase complex
MAGGHQESPDSPGNTRGVAALRRVVRDTTTHRVMAQLKERIVSREFRPGEKLPSERELAEMLGVSRPALREALQALSALRLLNIRQGDGIYVASLETATLLEPLSFVLMRDETAVEQVFETRLIVEIGIARVAARRMTAEAGRRLDEHLRTMEAVRERPEEFHRADVAFHDEIASLVPNPFVTVLLQSLGELGEAARAHVCSVPGALDQAILDHRRITEALKARDPEAASVAVNDHIENVLRIWQRARAETDTRETEAT